MRTARIAAAAIDSAMAEMEAEDQLILKMRFWSALRIPQIASTLGLDARKVYKRIDRLLTKLRFHLEKSGVAAGDVGELLAHPDHEMAFDWGKAESGHSHSADGELQMKSGTDGAGDAAF